MAKRDFTKWEIQDTEDKIRLELRLNKKDVLQPKVLARLHRKMITKGETGAICREDVVA